MGRENKFIRMLVFFSYTILISFYIVVFVFARFWKLGNQAESDLPLCANKCLQPTGRNKMDF